VPTSVTTQGTTSCSTHPCTISVTLADTFGITATIGYTYTSRQALIRKQQAEGAAQLFDNLSITFGLLTIITRWAPRLAGTRKWKISQRRLNTLFFSGWVLALAITVIYAVYIALIGKENLGIFIATALAAISYPFVILVERYLWTPDLELEFKPGKSDIYRPSMVLAFPDPITNQIRMTNERVFVRVGVRNNGGKTAKHCVGEIKSLRRPEGCSAFSEDPKVLQWTRSTEPIDILPKQSAVIAVAFAEAELSSGFGGECKFQVQPLIRAWAATTEAIRAPQLRLQDGFCRGEFGIKVTIYSENSVPISKEFTLSVSEKHADLTMDLA